MTKSGALSAEPKRMPWSKPPPVPWIISIGEPEPATTYSSMPNGMGTRQEVELVTADLTRSSTPRRPIAL